ncbi:MAG: hypothetical protein K2I06_09765 [Ruminococcus sp.]|nr:hypothetical protein [Ruminococcus sp.]
MSDNTQNNFNEKSERALSEIKSKWKTILLVAVVAVIILVVVFKLVGAVFSGGGNSMNKKTIDALQQQNPKKVLSCVPDDFAEAVMDYYDLSKDELNEAIEEANMLTAFNEIRTVKVKKKKIVDKKKYTLKSLDKEKNARVRSYVNASFDIIEKVWDTDDLKKFYMTQFTLILKDEDDGEKTKEGYGIFSVKYKGKWYSIDCMTFLVDAAAQHVQRQISKEKYPELFN